MNRIPCLYAPLKSYDITNYKIQQPRVSGAPLLSQVHHKMGHYNFDPDQQKSTTRGGFLTLGHAYLNDAQNNCSLHNHNACKTCTTFTTRLC